MARASGPYQFMSYARTDIRIAKVVFRELYASGIDIWVDSDDIPGGAEWPTEIDGAIAEAENVVLMLTQAAVESRQVWREVKLALELEKPIIPVELRATELPPRFNRTIGRLQRLPLTQSRQERTGLIIDAINGIASPRVPGSKDMVFRHNQRFIAETLRFLQEVSFNGGHLIAHAVTDIDNYEPYVQFLPWRADTKVYAEAVGNQNLPRENQLSARQLTQLSELGWLKPTKRSVGNLQRTFQCDNDADRRTVANLALRTLLEVYGHLPGEEIRPEVTFD